MKDKFKENWWTIPLAIIVIISLVAGFKSISYYFNQFKDFSISDDPKNWAGFANYFGGTLTPILTLINICVTIWLTVTVNKYAKFNSAEQIRTSLKVVRTNLKHEALKELRNEINLKFNKWNQSFNNLQNVQDCIRTLSNFQENYNYLFDLNNIDSIKIIINILENAQNNIINNNLTGVLGNFAQADIARQNLLSELGENVLSD
jgi:NADH:ubiquinone oxidoreductase subunit 5 (subunit L)/multisubunit Na+/H+ antiporter MnhA subunit